MLENEKTCIQFGEEYEKEEFGLIDDGDYEVVLKAEVRKTKDGSKDFLNLGFKIREDVDQPFKGRYLFEAAWRDKGNPNLFDFKKINSIIVTQKGLPTYQTKFKDMDEVILYLNGLQLLLTVETSFDEYSGQEKNFIAKKSFRPSVWNTKVQTQAENANAGITIPDDELPF